MRLGVLADLHGNAPALDAVLAALRQEGIERLLVAGDLVGYYPLVNETLDLLRRWPADVVLGNHDAYLLGRLPCSDERWRAYGLDVVDRLIVPAHREWLRTLPFERRLTYGGRRLLLCHGSPAGPEDYVFPDRVDWSVFSDVDADIVVLGHTHRPLSRTLGGMLIVNPGSVGQPRDYDPRAAYGIVDVATGVFEQRRIVYDVDTVRRAVRAQRLPDAFEDILVRKRSL
jgi:putative phosphoesterase